MELTSLLLLAAGGLAGAWGVQSLHRQRGRRLLERFRPLFAGTPTDARVDVEGLLAAAARARAEHELLTDNLAASVAVRDAAGALLWCSPYTEVLTGYARSEITGTPGDFFESIMHEQDRPRYQRAMKVTAAGEPFQFRYRFYHRSGLEMWAETRTVPVLDDDGSVRSSLSITIDVTGTVRYQRQVEERNRDLQDFTYMVSHDLKSPIATIKGMVGILREDCGPDLPTAAHEPLDHIGRAAIRLEQLVASIIQLCRIAFIDNVSERVDLNDLFRDLARDHAPALDQCGGTLIVPPGLPELRSDRVKLLQIFGNLIGNAIKYRSAERPLQIKIAAQPVKAGHRLRVTVSDNGLGIPADRIGAIFRPFHRAHDAGIEGSGIGLATVKKLSERLGGDVTVESTLGEGAVFTVTLRTEPERG